MGHYARINAQGLVSTVIVAKEDFINSLDNADSWVKTSYNTIGGVHLDPETREPSADQSKALRKNFAGVGMKYDSERDAFYAPQPFASWSLNEETCLWEPPYEEPELTQEDEAELKFYIWNEELHNSTGNGWSLVGGTIK